MTRTRLAIKLALLALVLAVPAAPGLAQSLRILWASERLVALPAHPIRLYPDLALPPQPLVVWFVADTANRETCLAIVQNTVTGEVLAPTTVPGRSCK